MTNEQNLRAAILEITEAYRGTEHGKVAESIGDAFLATLAAHEEAAKPAEPVAWAISYDGKTPYVLWDYGDGALLDLEIKRLGGTAQKMALYDRVAVAGWRPIESAPKDGSLLLLKEKWEDEPFIGQWVSSAYGGWWAASRTHYDTDGNACVIDCVYSEGVTHWMHLPPAPKEQA